MSLNLNLFIKPYVKPWHVLSRSWSLILGLHLLMCVCVCVCVLQFKDVQLLTGHLESLLHFKDQLYQRESEAQEQTDQQRKALLTLEDQHHLLRLQKNNQLSQLQTELEKTRSESLTWVSDIIRSLASELRPHQMLLKTEVPSSVWKFSCPCLHTGKEVEPHSGNGSKESTPAGTD